MLQMSDKSTNSPSLVLIYDKIKNMSDEEKEKYINNIEDKMKEYRDDRR